MSGGICSWGKWLGGTCPGGDVLEPFLSVASVTTD